MDKVLYNRMILVETYQIMVSIVYDKSAYMARLPGWIPMQNSETSRLYISPLLNNF